MSGGDERRGELDHVVSDPELITQVRAGDRSAFGELYRRHVGPANTLARQFARTPAEADDLVSEAFARVLDQLLTGHGPDTAFRAYLFTSLRNTAYDRTRKDRRLQFTDDMTGHDQAVPGDDPVVAQVESGMVAAAFARLPERWQAVLWHTQVEGESPAAVGAMLGMAPGAVSSLAFRAREGLREAYLQAHLADTAGETCRTTVERLGAWTRGGLSKREKAQVDAHLAGCDRCRTLAAELQEVNTGLRALLAPVLLGAAAAGYLATLGPIAPVAAVGLLGAATPAGLGAAATGTGSGGAGTVTVSGGSAGAMSAGATGTTAGAATGTTAGAAGAAGAATGTTAGAAGVATGTTAGAASAAGTTAGALGTAGTVSGTGTLGAVATAGAASGAASGAAGGAMGLTAGAAHLVGATGVVATSTVAGVGAGAGVATAGVLGATAGAGAAAAGAAAVGGAVAGGAAIAGTAAAGAAVAGASLATTGLLAVGTAAAAAAVTGSVIALSDVAPSTTVDTAAATTISAAPTSSSTPLPNLYTDPYDLIVDSSAVPIPVTDAPVTTPPVTTDEPVAPADGSAAPSAEPSDELNLLLPDPLVTDPDATDLYELAEPTVPVVPLPVVPVIPVQTSPLSTSPAPTSPEPTTEAPATTDPGPTATPDPGPSTTETPPPSSSDSSTPPSTGSTDTPGSTTPDDTPTGSTSASTSTGSTSTASTSTASTSTASTSTASTQATEPPATTTTAVPSTDAPPPPALPVVQLPTTPFVLGAGSTSTIDIDLTAPADGGEAPATTASLEAPAGLALQSVDIRRVAGDSSSAGATTITCATSTRCELPLPAVASGDRVTLGVTLAVADDVPASTQLSLTIAGRSTPVPVTVVTTPVLPATPQVTLAVTDGAGLTAGVPATTTLTADRSGPVTLDLRTGELWVVGYPEQCQVDGDRLTCPGPTVDGLTVVPRPGSAGAVQPSVTVDGRPAAVTGVDGAALAVTPRTPGAPVTFAGPFGGTMVTGSADPAGTELTIPADATVFWAELTWTSPSADGQGAGDGSAERAAAGTGVDLVRGDRTTRVDGVVPPGATADGISVRTADVTAALAAKPSAGTSDRVAVTRAGDAPADGLGWSLTVVWSAPGTGPATVSTAGALAAPLAGAQQVTVLSTPAGVNPVLSGWATVWRADAATTVTVSPPGCPPVEVSAGPPTAVVAFGACPPASGDDGPQAPNADLTIQAATPADGRRSWAGPALVIRSIG